MDEVLEEYGVPERCQRDRDQKWNGWGYKDSYFKLNQRKDVTFTGDRYDISGKVMPNFRPWFEENLGVDITYETPSQDIMSADVIPRCVLNREFVDWLKNERVSFSNDKQLRLNRGHGHTVHDMMLLRQGRFPRLPDIVVWPKNHDQVVKIVENADKMGVAVIPIGDLTMMDRILWIDPKNQLVRAEAGILGVNLEKQLNAKGFTTGHEPDSIEFSSLGGWVATRASGMKKNKYGNIEDLLVHVTVVTPRGVLQKSCQVPRISAGPDIHQFILGSEGTLGVITEVSLKICPVPECKRFGSIIFHSFEPGLKCMREVARQKCWPASMRLVDNEQFIMGQALKVAPDSYFKMFFDKIKKLYVTKWKGYDPAHMCAATLVFEGNKEEVANQEQRVYEIAKSFGGLPAGEENGRYGYRLTFAIAYLRDLGFQYSVLGESFETSVPWDKTYDLCRNVKELLQRETKRHGVQYPILGSCRVTQLYDSGACVYFYFGFNYRGLPDPLHVYEEIEAAARNEILACGGSISHHHGIGKLRSRWLPETVGEVGLSAMRAVKNQLDPNNTFANGNLFEPMPKL